MSTVATVLRRWPSVRDAQLPKLEDEADRDLNPQEDPVVALLEFREFIDMLRGVDDADQCKRRLQLRTDERPILPTRQELVRGVNYFCRLATTISAGEEPTKERRPPPGGTRLLSAAGW